MAKKGQKFNKYSAEFIQEILQKYHAGQGSARALGLEYGISYKTLSNWLAKEKREIDVRVDHRKTFNGRTKEEKID